MVNPNSIYSAIYKTDTDPNHNDEIIKEFHKIMIDKSIVKTWDFMIEDYKLLSNIFTVSMK